MTQRMPVLFIGHGSPLNAIADNDYTRSLGKIAKSVPKPNAVMVVSAHWLTDHTYVSCTKKPKIIYDFFGFPPALYELTYPCAGAPESARSVPSLVTHTNVQCNDTWGIDHAAWAVLRHMYPAADIPVFEMSIAYKKPAEYHYQLAQQLLPLRDQGILIIGSGNVVHNLRLADFHNMDAKPLPWAEEFDTQIKRYLGNKDHESLIHYTRLTGSSLAIPTNDHYLPLMYLIGLQQNNENVHFIFEGIQNASVSMLSLICGPH
ncbi:MAG TPA: 4,5-DOPA dioxygenase extradiol [Methylomusa anaerophila]|uniref:LigB family dioxygenase n=1 Tax=Methylomusa anaerophila TaxID=1930071 RepID=A0A348AQ57_9FIRM|nr:4,5-DOPA dioxygenase extradiol [Methylomusa anaerophila]BBB93205.1 LigB family dioxygenase [Methylomusa anaerophila]HML86963.1 4,5-DOPA dioxygenase extradiol [Methylomusa anaerophila]